MVFEYMCYFGLRQMRERIKCLQERFGLEKTVRVNDTIFMSKTLGCYSPNSNKYVHKVPDTKIDTTVKC